MRGSNHSIMNLVTAGFIGVTGFFIANTDSPDFLKTTVIASKDFLIDNSDMPLVFYGAIVFVMYLIGSILPDIDHPYSKIGKIIHLPVKHRTWTHAIWIPVCLLITGIFFRWVFWLGLGYFFHLFWDSFSVSGVDWFYPKKNKNHKIKLYRTSQTSEYITVSVSVAIFLLYAVFVAQCVYHFIR